MESLSTVTLHPNAGSLHTQQASISLAVMLEGVGEAAATLPGSAVIRVIYAEALRSRF